MTRLAYLAGGVMANVLQYAIALGALGVFLLGIADSSFLFLPFGNDLLVIALVSRNRDSSVWMLYVLLAAAGSVVGSFVTDLLARKLGEEGLENFVPKKRVDKLRTKMENHAGRAVFVATLMPPPFPFTAVVMTAAALQSPRRAILVAVFFGRLVRFTIEALLAKRYGERVLAVLDSPYVEYAMYALAAIAVVGTTVTLRKWLKSRSSFSGRNRKADEPPAEAA